MAETLESVARSTVARSALDTTMAEAITRLCREVL